MRKSNIFLTAALLALSFAAPASAGALASCGADGLRRYVGKPVASLKRIRRANVRFVCTTCAATMDFSAERLTVVFDAASGRIRKLGCN